MTRSAESSPPRLRVLIITDEMEVGGTQRQIVHLARGLDRQRFEATVLYFRERSFLVDELERDGIRTVHVPKRGRIDPAFVVRLRRAVAALRPDVVHCFAFSGELWGTLACALPGRGPRPALVSSIRGTYEWYRPWQWRIKSWVSARSAHVVSNSRQAGDFAARQMGLAPSAIDVVYNGAVLPALDDIAAARVRMRAELGLAPLQPMILFVGRLVDHKNIPLLLRAMQLLVARVPGAQLMMAGDGPLRSETEQGIAALGLANHVRLLGERNDAPALMAACDLLVLCSLREGLSNVILEAMMSRCAVVASRVGGNVELVDDGVTGLLFTSDDAAQLSAALQRLIDDPALRQRCAEQGRAKAVAQFGIDAMVRAYERLYQGARRPALPAQPLQPLQQTQKDS
ncbi:MAG: glycosyltransferase [Burkholderiales bacterium]